ncbi:peptidylprolyl isomerase [Candidatus Pelagibacter sp.]|nr:peptidylprolyl isomerase [Candidatus Pelagibacter sp.]MDC3042266.1 peptidylprolyl isomerase [Candidatus Pelagibacter sp.]
MIKAIKASKSEKILFIFLICLSIFTFSSFFLLKNKCLFIEKNNLTNLNFNEPNNIAVMDVECGNVIIELYPDISPKAVERFKILIEKKMYDGSAFYKVSENTFVQAGDIEYGNINNLDYSKIGSGKSGLGLLKSELNNDFKFIEGSVGFARTTEFDTEDSEFFITLKEIPIYQGEYTPIGKVIYGLDILTKIKTGNKAIYVLRPDYIKTLRLLNSN